MADGHGTFPHGNVKLEEIKHKDVIITHEPVTLPSGRDATKKHYEITYTLPIAVSSQWQEFFEKSPTTLKRIDPKNFKFSAKGKEVSIVVKNKPSVKLLEILRSYSRMANDHWGRFQEIFEAKRKEEAEILEKLREQE